MTTYLINTSKIQGLQKIVAEKRFVKTDKLKPRSRRVNNGNGGLIGVPMSVIQSGRQLKLIGVWPVNKIAIERLPEKIGQPYWCVHTN